MKLCLSVPAATGITYCWVLQAIHISRNELNLDCIRISGGLDKSHYSSGICETGSHPSEVQENSVFSVVLFCTFKGFHRGTPCGRAVRSSRSSATTFLLYCKLRQLHVSTKQITSPDVSLKVSSHNLRLFGEHLVQMPPGLSGPVSESNRKARRPSSPVHI